MALTMLDPTYRAKPTEDDEGSLAPRLPSVEGRTIGLLMNRLADCDRMLDQLGAILQERYGAAEIVSVTKGSQSVPPTEQQWNEIRRADAVITGFGGCGSCSTRSMRDALDLEEWGVPSVCVGHAALLPGVRLITEIAGQPEYEMVTIDYPHSPIARWDHDEAREIAEELVERVVDRLTA